MLKLKSLELAGFKSFADKTRLAFSGGITTIIGPNGCGKSNLSDALGWVLGSQSAKSLRGQKMEEFIFGGSRRRRPSGLAEVTLTLEGSEEASLGIDGLEFSGPEFEITRKLYRSGESHYLINNRRCRLMDILEFLERGGLGFASYAMIAQGQIESFLTARPLDRRTIIEEAAQITGYKTKRRNAELKLEMAQQNLLRVNDIIAEIERQLRSLKRQASKTRAYRRLKEEFRAVQRQRLKSESSRLSRELAEVQRNLAELRAAESSVSERLEDEHRAFRERSQAREAIEARLVELRERKSGVELELARTEDSERYSREQLTQTRLDLESLGTEREQLDASINELRRDLERYVSQEKAVVDEEGAALEQVRLTQEQVRDANSEMELSEARLEELRTRLMASTAEAASLRNLREQLVQRVARIESERSRLLAERETTRRHLQEARLKMREKEDRLKNCRTGLEGVESAFQLERERVDALTADLQVSLDEEAEIQNHLVALKERLQSLQELELNRSHYTDGVRAVLGHLSKSGSVGTSGTLSDSIETDAEFEKLVEAFLDEELEYILVDSLDEAVRGVSEVRTLKSGKCTFLSLFSSNGFGRESASHAPRDLPDRNSGVYGTLASVLKMKPEVEEAFLRVLPAQADAIVVSDMNRAMELSHSYPESTFITLGGDSLTPRGLVSCSSSGSAKIGLLGLKRQRRELERKCEAQQKARARAASVREQKQQELSVSKTDLDGLQARRHQLEKEAIGLVHERDQAEDEVRRQERLLDTIRMENEQLDTELTEVQSGLEGLVVKLGAQDEIQAEANLQLKLSREAQGDLKEELARFQEQANAALSQRKVLEERRNSIVGTVNRIRRQLEEADQRLQGMDSREAEGCRRAEELEEAIGRLEVSVVRLKQDRKAMGLQLDELQERFRQCRDSLQEKEAEVEALRQRRDALMEDRSRREIEQARVETQIQHLDSQCREQLGTTLAEAVVDVEVQAGEEEDILALYEKLKQRIESFGPINMTALQEYQENLERHTFLTGQKADIEQSISDTLKAIQEINRRSRVRFSEAFEAVNRNFKEVFQRLFEGGECGMTLLDEEDVLEAGIDVYAQPPGKRLQNVMLLSGGEKALTVFALLVGIFMYRPSRFCVLDEVDAPLDDANVQRFNRLIREMSEQAQFIVVTHNKRTMERSDAMYGITMEEPGVSKVVSARF